MGALRASHHNFHQLYRELCLACAGPWTARVISDNATREVLAVRLRRSMALNVIVEMTSGVSSGGAISSNGTFELPASHCKPLIGSGRAMSQERHRQDDVDR